MKKLILFGDSLFGQVSKSELLLLEKKLDGRYDVYNCATGGWDTNDLLAKAPYIAQLKPDVLLLSVGTNDASYWKQVDLRKFQENLQTIVDSFKCSRVVFFLPPPTKEEWQPESKRRSNETLKEYYDTAKHVCNLKKIKYIESWEDFMPLIENHDVFHVNDGVHISDAGYDAVFDSIVRILRK